MRLSALRVLAVATTSEERARRAVTVAALAVAGALVIAAARVARIDGALEGVASYLGEPGLRLGVVFSALLLALPVLLLARQAGRLGSTARARRSQALVLAGADRRQVRRVAAATAVPAGLHGGFLAGPVYLLLWVLLGVLPPRPGMRLLPTPEVPDIAVWIVVTLLATVAAAVAGAADGTPRRRDSRPSRRAAVAAVAAVVGLAVVALVVVVGNPLPLLLAPPLLAGPATILLARRMRRRGSATDLLAGSRLAAAPGPASRAAALLAVCGLAWGVQGSLLVSVLGRPDGVVFYLVGIGLTAAVAVLAAAAAVTGLLVAAADQVLSAPRAAATLATLGLDGPAARRVLRRQLTAVGAPLAAVGALVALPTATLVEGAPVAATLVVLVGVPLGAWLAVHGLAALSVSAVGSTLAGASAPENLRAG